MTLSPQLLKGFLAEAHEYVVSLRGVLDSHARSDDPAALATMQEQITILGQGAEMLDLETVAALANPASDLLTTVIADGRSLDATDHSTLVAVLDQLEAEIAEVEHGWEPDEAIAVDQPPAATDLWPDLPPELREIFTIEATEHHENIQQGLETLRQNPADRDALSEVRRVTHTLKGAASSIGFERIAQLAHAMEDLTELHLSDETALGDETITLLLETADMIEALLFPAPGQNATSPLHDLERRYASLLRREPPTHIGLTQDGSAAAPAPISGATPADNVLRLPLQSVDLLINQVGEIVINRSISERHVGDLFDLLTDLNNSTRRLRRVAREIETQVSVNPQLNVEVDEVGFDPLELDRYTRLHETVRELEEAAHDTNDLNARLNVVADEFSAVLNRERRLTTQLQEDLLSVRLVPFSELQTRLHRVVQRTARAVGKSVELVLEGLSTEVDKTILNSLVDPLTHLLRNAVDHGIEDAATRRQAGKAETGRITLSIRRERGRIALTLTDDGDGIDLDGLEAIARRDGLLDADEAIQPNQLLNLLSVEGLSLAQHVTETSGRGLGMNIARRAIEGLQGTISVRSQQGIGTTFTISLPVTLAITRALFVKVGDFTFAVPLDQITAVLRLEAAQLDEVREHKLLTYQNQTLAVHDLAAFAGTPRQDAQTVRPGLLIESGEQSTVVLVDSLAGTGEAVIKSLGTHLRRVHGIAGGTISGDGSVILILDVLEIIAGKWQQTTKTPVPPSTKHPPSPSDQWHVLVVDDSISVRHTVCSLLERHGWQATPARDGLDALHVLDSTMPDVALVDIEMPRMNGFELLTRIKSDPTLKHLPVVILTSRSASKHRSRAEELGVDGYLVKPYREELLIGTLRQAIGATVE